MSALGREDKNFSSKMMMKGKNDKLENIVYKWFLQQRSIGQLISETILCEKVLMFVKNMVVALSSRQAKVGYGILNLDMTFVR